PYLDVSLVGVIVDPSSLSPGDYYGQIQVSATAVNSPQLITVVLNVLPSTSSPGPEVRPSGLIFTGTANGSPSAQDVVVGNPRVQPDGFLSGSIGRGFTYTPTNADIPSNQPATLRVTPDYTSLAAGSVERGTITLQFNDGTAR